MSAGHLTLQGQNKQTNKQTNQKDANGRSAFVPNIENLLLRAIAWSYHTPQGGQNPMPGRARWWCGELGQDCRPHLSPGLGTLVTALTPGAALGWN